MNLRIPRVMPFGHTMLSVTKAKRSTPFNPHFSILACSPQSVQYMKLKRTKSSLKTNKQGFWSDKISNPTCNGLLTCWWGRPQWLAASPGFLRSMSFFCCRLSSPRRCSSKCCRSSRCCRGSSPLRCPLGPRFRCQSLRCGVRSCQPRLSRSCQEWNALL